MSAVVDGVERLDQLERVATLAGTALIALHVVDDRFIQPAGGTTASDHAPGGLLILALLALLAWTQVRLRPGFRALAGLTAGLFGLIVAGFDAGYHVAQIGPSGDDYTGLLAGLAGAALVGSGVRTLWRQRHRTGPRRWTRRLLAAVVAVVVLFQVAFPTGLAYMATHSLRADVPAPDLGAEHLDVTFMTSDGLRLSGWYVPSRNGAAVIAFPGRSTPQPHTRMLVSHGYGVLLFDRRGEGASEGDGNLFGWGGDEDVHAAVRFLQGRPDVDPDRIGGIGFSVGGELMLQAASRNDGLRAVVSEGAGTRSLSEELEELSPSVLAWALPFLTVKTGAVAVFSDTRPPPKLIDLIPDISAPVLLIWAPNGGNAETMNPAYYRALTGPKQIWEIPDARHVKGLQKHPEEYERRVVGFFDQALRSPGSP